MSERTHRPYDKELERSLIAELCQPLHRVRHFTCVRVQMFCGREDAGGLNADREVCAGANA